MKLSRVVLPCLLVAASVLTAPQTAAAASCQYTRQDLPLPATTDHVSTEASSADDSRIAGQFLNPAGYGRAVLWTNGVAEELPPLGTYDHVIPRGVNNTGVVAGYRQQGRGLGAQFRAFRYENGAYEFLETSVGTQSKAVAVNNAGDVLGFVWTGDREEDSGQVVLWPRTGPRLVFGTSTPIGVTDDRKIVTKGFSSTAVFDADTRTGVQIPGSSARVVLDNGQVLRGEIDWSGYTTVTRWNLDGTPVATYESGIIPFGSNSSGTVFSTYRPSPAVLDTHALWHDGSRTDIAGDQLPFTSVHGDITDDGTLIGTYTAQDGKARPALWVCG